MTSPRPQHLLARGSPYIDDGGLKTFQVENTLFRVHTYFLVENSAVLRSMLAIGLADTAEGSSDAHPIVLREVKAADFSLMLNMFYTPAIGGRTGVFGSGSLESCLSLLKLLDFFEMKDIREHAVDALRQRDTTPVEKLYLLRMLPDDFDKAWAGASFVDLCTRPIGPDAEEGKLIGWEAFALVWHVRESCRQGMPNIDVFDVQQELSQHDAAFEFPSKEPVSVLGGWGTNGTPGW
ncbi:hypothetical protein GGF50DRAFT_119111 [Schizophyllum commune]